MIAVLMVVRRERSPRWAPWWPDRWTFWRRRAAYAYVTVDTDDVGRAVRTARARLAERGWKVDRVENRRVVSDDPAKEPYTARLDARLARKHGVWHKLMPISPDELGPPAPVEVTSRYVDAEGVAIDPARVPEDLRPLLPLAERWAIGDDVERAAFIESASDHECEAFIDAVEPFMDAVEAFCGAGRSRTPVPDEVVLLDMLAESFAEAQCRHPART